jgi:predicted dehydrogenase
MDTRVLGVTINGTGFAGTYTAQVYGQIPHKNGVAIELRGVCSGHRENAERFAAEHGVGEAFEGHREMLEKTRPDIDNIACANNAHGPYVKEAAALGVPVIVLEKPPVIWPGFPEGRNASARTKKEESMDYLATVLDAVRDSGSKLLYAEDFVYFDGIKGIVETLREAVPKGKGRILHQTGICGHQGSHAPAYDTPALSGGGSLFNKACHPLGPILYLKEVEGILRDGTPIRPHLVTGLARQVLKGQTGSAGEHFRVMQNVDDFGRISVVFQDGTIAEVVGSDLSITGIRNQVSVITDFCQYDVRVNPNNANELFLPEESVAGSLLFREKLPTARGTSFPMPNQLAAHGYVNEMEDAVDCALQPERFPQSGPLLAWDTMAVLMAAYESSERDSVIVDVSDYVDGREFGRDEGPTPEAVAPVFQRL